jgi:hypothetical protein
MGTITSWFHFPFGVFQGKFFFVCLTYLAGDPPEDLAPLGTDLAGEIRSDLRGVLGEDEIIFIKTTKNFLKLWFLEYLLSFFSSN